MGLSRPSGDPIEGLLDELCVGLGYCSASRELDRSAAAAMSVDDLTDAVLAAEGLDREVIAKRQRGDVREVVAGWLDV